MYSADLILGILLVGIVTVGIVFYVRNRVRGLWIQHEHLKNNIQELKNAEFQHYRQIYGDITAILLDRKNPVPFRSQHGEDILLWNFFGRKTNGCFVEVGAHDGITFSNTHGLESIGWNGVLVEADPESYKSCIVNRSAAQVVHAAVGAPLNDTLIDFSSVRGHPGADLLSFMTADSRHLARLQRVGVEITTVQVPHRRLDSILEECSIKKIDLITIDVEGAEMEVLKGFDIGKYAPDVIVVENNSGAEETPPRKYLGEHGYKRCLVIECNEFYVRNGECRSFFF